MKAPAPHLAQAASLVEAGRVEEARTLLMRHVKGAQTHPHTYHLLAIAHELLGQQDQAIYFAQRAAAADPSDVALQLGLAQRQFTFGQTAAALKTLQSLPPGVAAAPEALSARVAMLGREGRDEEALALAASAPAQVRAHPLVADAEGVVLEKLGRLDEALAIYRRTGRVFGPVNALSKQGRIRDAADALKAICERFPHDEGGWTYYASTLNYIDDAPLEEVLRAHTEYARAVRARYGAPERGWNATPEPERKLRIGIVSPDLRRHAIVSFLAPLLENYDKSRWHVVAYHTHLKTDEVTARLRTLVDEWRHMPSPQPAYVARRIRDDRIDVVIELSGHTEGHRLDALSLRPAPVQVTYLGYPNTTGLDTMDVRLVDSITDPPGAERWATEKLVRIDPCFLCYKPIDGAPPLAPPPMLERGHVSFGSFNLPKKISPRILKVWARVLATVPGSRLVLKHVVLDKPWQRERLHEQIAAAGIDAARVTVLPPAPAYSDHLAAYGQMDIALDTYPYHGTTTTCEAMWMGVPVVTLQGDRHPARVGGSLLNAVGLGDLVASSEGEFVRVATALASDTPRLTAWRTDGPGSLRAQMAASPLCDARAFAARFQGAIREAWRSWCASQTAGAAQARPRPLG